MEKAEQHEITEAPAGRGPGPWSKAAGICRATYYNLPDELKPAAVRIGAKVLIVESPLAWLNRMVDRGGVVALKKPQRKTQ